MLEGSLSGAAELPDYPEVKPATFELRAWECRLTVSPKDLDFEYEKSRLILTLKREGCGETVRFQAIPDAK